VCTNRIVSSLLFISIQNLNTETRTSDYCYDAVYVLDDIENAERDDVEDVRERLAGLEQ